MKTSYLHKNVGNTNVSNCQIILSFPVLLYWNKIKKTVWYSDKEVEYNRLTFFNSFLIRCFEICQQAKRRLKYLSAQRWHVKWRYCLLKKKPNNNFKFKRCFVNHFMLILYIVFLSDSLNKMYRKLPKQIANWDSLLSRVSQLQCKGKPQNPLAIGTDHMLYQRILINTVKFSLYMSLWNIIGFWRTIRNCNLKKKNTKIARRLFKTLRCVC